MVGGSTAGRIAETSDLDDSKGRLDNRNRLPYDSKGQLDNRKRLPYDSKGRLDNRKRLAYDGKRLLDAGEQRISAGNAAENGRSRRPRPRLALRACSERASYNQLRRRQDRFVFGMYRRQMKAISYLGQLEKVFGVPVTTRNWNTILTVARILGT